MHLYQSTAAAALLFLNAVSAEPNAFAQPGPILLARQISSDLPTSTSSASDSLTTSETILDSSPGAAAATTLTGRFTAGANGIYSITSVSNYIEVAGRTLSAGGADALVGGIRVSVGTDGVVAGGQSVALAELTATSTESTLVLTSEEPTAVSSVPGQASTEAGNTETAEGRSQGGSGPMATARVGAAVVGGLIGVLAL